MKLSAEVEDAWRRFEDNARAYGADDPVLDELQHYTERETFSQTWATAGKLIRLDDAVMSLHVMSARHTFRGITKIGSKALNALRLSIVGIFGSVAAKRIAGQIIGRTAIGVLGSVVARTIGESAFQLELESSVRTASFEVRADLFNGPLRVNPKRVRKTKLVYTRNG